MLFSIRMGNSLENRIECRFIAGVFSEKEEKIKVNKEVVDGEKEDILKYQENFLQNKLSKKKLELQQVNDKNINLLFWHSHN